MPFQFTIDTEKNLIRETWTGTIDVQQLYESCKQEWAHPDYRKEMNMLSDFRKAQIDITQEELTAFAQFMGEQEAVQRHAIIVGRDVGFGLARMFTVLSESSSPYWDSLRVYYDLKNGEVWLNTGLRPIA